MTRDKVLEAVKLIRTGEVVSLGMPYDTRMPIAPGRAYALRMPGGPTGGPYGGKSRTIWNDEFIATEIGQIGTQMDALGHLGCMCGALGDKTHMLFYNGNRLSEMWSPYGLKKLGIENAPPFFTRGVLFDVQGLKGRVARRRRGDRARRPQSLPRASRRARGNDNTRRRRVRAHGSWKPVVHRNQNLLRRSARHRTRMRALVFELTSLRCRRGQFRCRSRAAGRSGDLSSVPSAPHHGERNPPS